MSVDDDFETLLRQQFRIQEPQVGAAGDLTTRVVADGMREIRKRRTRFAICTCVGAVALVAGVSMTGLRSAPNAGNGPDVVPATSNGGSEGPAEKQALAEWADGLPRGAAPEVAYVAGTTVYVPGGAVTELDVADAAIIGQTVAGLIVFVEETDARGVLTGTRFVLVRDDGTTVNMQTSTRIAGAAREALVSPDGLYFTNGDQVIDKSTGASVGEMPEEAEVLVSWTSEGIIYAARGQEYYLWRLGEAPILLDGLPGVYDFGTDVGMRESGNGCREVVRIEGTGEVTPAGAGCVPDLLSVSPGGTTGLTTDLQVIDIATSEASPLSDTPLADVYSYVDVHWLNDEEFLVSVPAESDVSVVPPGSSRLVRCRISARSCESATGSLSVGDNGSVLLP